MRVPTGSSEIVIHAQGTIYRMAKEGKHAAWSAKREYLGGYEVKVGADDNVGEMAGGESEVGGALDSFFGGGVYVYVLGLI